MTALPGPADTEAFGAALGSLLRAGDVVALSGPLGAGKTTLARGILRGLGFAGDVASPSFPIVIAYEPPALSLPLWHVDLYRIEHRREMDELGLDDALLDSALLVEWPERLGERVWRHALRLDLGVRPDGARSLTAQVPEAWEARWPPR